ncbi:MAG: YigZ family protein [Candidatus Cloacimonetes bacterium]|nr:YigZ family protein [Candidatus Cloacimonadota bacterium]HOA29112.1 YigZ family protein [Candidatus Cloacimonadota bacterium]HOH59961.1 YigZ family protein [Candidatus Cloacimonadota bacterium]
MLQSIQTAQCEQLKIQRSEFLSFIFPVKSSESVQEILKEHQNTYANATHNCYAYVLGYSQETQYYSDAGEPSGTAGKPILNSILRNELSGVLIIVTRYFGGIKLGVKGLIEAYTQSAQAAIDASERIPLILYHGFTITTDYAFVDGLRHQMAAFGALEITSDYTQRVCLNVNVPEESLAAFEDFLIGYQAMGRLIFIRED